MFGRQNGTRWHLFDLFGHPVYMEPFFLGLIALFAFLGLSAQSAGISTLVLNVLIWAPTIFIGVLFHELGHAIALQKFGYGSSTIVLQGFGGVTINNRRGNSPPGKSIIISLAGPFFSFLLAVLCLGGLALMPGAMDLTFSINPAGPLDFFKELLAVMGFINVVWAVFNLLPINPLDGGHVVLHALRGKFRNERKAMYYSAYSSLIVLGILVVVSLVVPIFDPFLFFILAAIFGMQNWQTMKAAKQGNGPRMGY